MIAPFRRKHLCSITVSLRTPRPLASELILSCHILLMWMGRPRTRIVISRPIHRGL